MRIDRFCIVPSCRTAGGPVLGPGSPNDPPDVFQPRPSAVSSHQAAATINTCSRSRAAIVLAPQPGNKQFVKLYHTIIPSIPSPQITSSVLRKRLDWLHCDLLFVNSARVPSLCYYTRWMPNEVNKNFPLCYPYKHIHLYM